MCITELVTYHLEIGCFETRGAVLLGLEGNLLLKQTVGPREASLAARAAG